MTNEAFMSLEINDLLFKNILDNLYSDIPLAIVRELCCNAADAHKVANNPDPFLVQIPTETSPLIVRDFGTGLSKSDVFLYLNKLMSGSKKEESDLTGKYGLGSKVVLALVDEYYIYSYFNGTRYDFMFKRVDRGVPLLSCIGESPTEEPNGLKYVIDFKSKRHSSEVSFKLNILKYFRIKPKVLYNIDDLDSEVEGYIGNQLDHICSNIYFVSDGNPNTLSYGSSRGLSIRLGDIVYPVSLSYLTESFLKWFSTHVNKSIIIDVEVDILELPMNREALSDSTHNTNALREIFINVEKDADKHYFSLINEELKTSYADFDDLRRVPYLEVLKVGKILLEKFNLDAVYGLIHKCSNLNNPTTGGNLGYRHSGIINLQLPDYLEGLYLQGDSLCEKETNKTLSYVSLSNYARRIIDKKVIFYHYDRYHRNTKLTNYFNSKGDEFYYSPIQWYDFNSAEVISENIKEKSLRFYKELAKIFSGVEPEYIPLATLEAEAELYAKEVAKEKRRQSRLIKAGAIESTTVSNLIGVRSISPNIFMSSLYKTIQSTSTVNIPDRKDADNKVIPFNSDYFPDAVKYLVIPNKGEYSKNICQFHIFDAIIVASPTKFDSVIVSLKENPNIQVYTMDTLDQYPLLHPDELERFLPVLNKHLLKFSIFKIFNVTFDNMPLEFSEILLNELERLSGDKDLIDSLDDSTIVTTHQFISTFGNDYNIKQRFSRYLDNFDSSKYHSLVRSVLTKEFIIANRENTIDRISDISILKDFINVLLDQT